MASIIKNYKASLFFTITLFCSLSCAEKGIVQDNPASILTVKSIELFSMGFVDSASSSIFGVNKSASFINDAVNENYKIIELTETDVINSLYRSFLDSPKKIERKSQQINKLIVRITFENDYEFLMSYIKYTDSDIGEWKTNLGITFIDKNDVLGMFRSLHPSRDLTNYDYFKLPVSAISLNPEN